jgi:flavin reductase (DIM6/NTAB) family NADH-FMN oxidoreductase RutF
MYVYEPTLGHGLRYDPFVAIVAPRPIGWISTQSAAGARNLAPYSFFNAFNYRPPIIGFSSIGWKDTLQNAKETGVFVWNLATRALAERMNETSARYAYGEDEFVRAGVTPEPGRLVAAPRVAESPVAFECRVSQIVAMQTAAGQALETWVVFGEVVAVQIDEGLIREGVYDTAAGAPIMRGGGSEEYFSIGEGQRFAMARPVLAPGT